MIIKVGSSTYLCQGVSANEHVMDMSGGTTRLLQDSRPIGAASAKVFDRANLAKIRTFRVVKTHADLAAAQAYTCTHEETVLAATGAITFQVDPGGTTYTLSDAAVESVELVSWIGLTTIWQYRIRGGIFS
jgi:hypothetical protein